MRSVMYKCALRENSVGRTYQQSWYISAHFVKAIKGKMLVADCPKARMQSRADEVRLSRPLTEWSDPHYPIGNRTCSVPLPNGECNCFATFSESRPSVDPSESPRSESGGVDNFRGVTLGGDYDPPRGFP